MSIAIATSIIAAATSPSHAQAFVYLGLAVILLVTIPIISRVPENRGSW